MKTRWTRARFAKDGCRSPPEWSKPAAHAEHAAHHAHPGDLHAGGWLATRPAARPHAHHLPRPRLGGGIDDRGDGHDRRGPGRTRAGQPDRPVRACSSYDAPTPPTGKRFASPNPAITTLPTMVWTTVHRTAEQAASSTKKRASRKYLVRRPCGRIRASKRGCQPPWR